MEQSIFDSISFPSKQWWKEKRTNYNKGLILSGIIAFILYVILASFLIAPYDPTFEITLFTTIFQGIGYLIMMGIANLFYNLGYFTEKLIKNTDERVRIRLYNIGFWFSFGLPFLVPLMIIITYLIEYHR